MSDKGYFIVWGVVEFKALHDLFCWTPPNIIEVALAVAFLCMYLTWYFLFEYEQGW